MSDSDKFDEATYLTPQPPMMKPTGTPTWLWFVLALLAVGVIAGAGFAGATIQGNTKDKTISAVENSLSREQGTATEAKIVADGIQADLEEALSNEIQRADDNKATAEVRLTQIADSDATADAESEARATQAEIAANESAARETADAGSTSIAQTARADSQSRATAEAESTESASARGTADAHSTESAATARAAIEFSETEVARAQSTESALRSELAALEATSDIVATEVADVSAALATQEGRAIDNAGTASAAQIENSQLQATIDALAAIPSPTPQRNGGGGDSSDGITRLVQSNDNLYSIRLPVAWSYEEEQPTQDALSIFYVGETNQDMASMRDDISVRGIGGTIFFFPADAFIDALFVDAVLETTIDFYRDLGGREITDPYSYTLANGRPAATQTVTYDTQDYYIYAIGFNRIVVVGLMTEPSSSAGENHPQLELIMVSVNSPPITTVSSGIDDTFNLASETSGLTQTVTSSDGRLRMRLPVAWDFEDTLATDNSFTYSGGLSFGSLIVIESDDPTTFPTNSAVAEMTLMTYLVNRFILDEGGHLLAEPNVFQRSDGVVAVYGLAEDGFGISRWSVVYLFEDGNIVIAQVSHIGDSSFPQVRDQLLAIVLSIEFSPSSGGSRPTG